MTLLQQSFWGCCLSFKRVFVNVFDRRFLILRYFIIFNILKQELQVALHDIVNALKQIQGQNDVCFHVCELIFVGRLANEEA